MKSCAALNLTIASALSSPRMSIACPKRPGAPNCEHYMKTGKCDYGTRCIYNHPFRPKALIQALDRRECFDYIQKGRCHYGTHCKYIHPPRAPQPSEHSQAPSASTITVSPISQIPHRSSTFQRAYPTTQTTASQSRQANTAFSISSSKMNCSSDWTSLGKTSTTSSGPLPLLHAEVHRYRTVPFWSLPMSINDISIPPSRFGFDGCVSTALGLHPMSMHRPELLTQITMQRIGNPRLLSSTISSTIPCNSIGNDFEHVYARTHLNQNKNIRDIPRVSKRRHTDTGFQSNDLLQARLSSATLHLCDAMDITEKVETALDVLREPGSENDIYVGTGSQNLFGCVGDRRHAGRQFA